MGAEFLIQESIANHLRENYPDVIFISDFASGARMSWGLIQKNNRVKGKRAFPDMFIAEPAKSRYGHVYFGLFLEIKVEGVKIFKKDGSFVNDHLREQYEILTQLNDKGYYAVFAFGFEQAKRIIDGYFGGNR